MGMSRGDRARRPTARVYPTYIHISGGRRFYGKFADTDGRADRIPTGIPGRGKRDIYMLH